jgi:lipopolysaccharide/colanic/teichoic acid biosynthesis glycosyltransferase
MDIVLSVVLLSICLPVFACAMLAIWLEGGGAIFYRQERVTQSNRVFWLYKLRTMRTDAEKDGARWASSTDSRVTKVGKFLRRTRIDEIPQLLNILKGDMSLVGPRPERPVFIDQISQEVQMFALRHGVKTGLTGWAQINYPYGASIEDAKRKLEYDLYYMKNYSWFRDISIILQTVRIVILQEGAR